MIAKSVLLPLPVGPTSAQIWPRGTWNDTSWSARTVLADVTYCLETAESRTMITPQLVRG